MSEVASSLDSQPAVFDVVILSFAKDDGLRAVTEHCLDTLIASEDSSRIQFRIFVLESNLSASPYAQPGVHTVFPAPPFNYHGYMNQGIKMGEAPFVAICNNDLSFHPGWATSLLEAFSADDNLYSASPICSLHHPRNGFELHSGIHHGYGVLREISGWCLVFRREMLGITGMLDERFYFWYADDDYARTLQEKGLLHGLVTDAVVDHLDSQTLKEQSTFRQLMITRKSRFVFDEKWSDKGRWHLARKKIKFYLQIPLYYLGLKKVFKK